MSSSTDLIHMDKRNIRPCTSCRYRYRWWFWNACQAPHVGIALIMGAPWRMALCSFQRRPPRPYADVKQTECGAEGIFWEAKR